MDTHAAVCAKVRPMVAHADDKAYFGNSVREPATKLLPIE